MNNNKKQYSSHFTQEWTFFLINDLLTGYCSEGILALVYVKKDNAAVL